MALPVVAVVGRPNVGKSSLFNSMAGSMISIVDPTAGVTRDRISAIIENDGRYFELVDTGGYGIVDADELDEHVNGQIRQAMDNANLAVFVVDIRDGVMPLDVKIAQLLRKAKLEVILVANKADNAKLFPEAGEFNKIGFGDAICVSAKSAINKRMLRDKIFEAIDHLPSDRPKEDIMKIAFVGKRNAGKSTFINAIVGEERVIVSEVPGTTRDAVDVRFEKDGQSYVAIDTAGLRKKSKIVGNDIEFYSYTRATRSVRRADVVLFLIDATLKISQVDKKLAGFISEEHKPCILVINKWDLAKDRADTEDYADYLTKVLPGLKYVPIAFTTAKDGRNIQSTLNLAKQLFKQSSQKLPTSKLNKAFEEIGKQRRSGSVKKVGWPKVFYATQIASNPITLLLFVNRVELFDENYQRFIINRLRDMLPVDEVPIRLVIKPRTRKDEFKE